jgi:hypothetical protein
VDLLLLFVNEILKYSNNISVKRVSERETEIMVRVIGSKNNIDSKTTKTGKAAN